MSKFDKQIVPTSQTLNTDLWLAEYEAERLEENINKLIKQLQ